MWLVVGIPVSAVIFGAIMLTISISTFDGLVEDDYYKKGLGINRILDREQRARDLGLVSSIELDPIAGTVLLDLAGNPGLIYPAAISLKFRYATRAGKDLAMQLQLNADNRYYGAFPGLSQGKWYLALESGEWLLTGILVWPAGGKSGIQLAELK